MGSIDDHAELRDHFGTVHPLAVRKIFNRLDGHCRRFISLSPFLVLASVDAAGKVDASPRGDAPGFVGVPDDATLVVPDRPGNNRVDSFGNVLETGRVGLLFLVAGLNDTLRVNGRARLVTTPALLEAHAVDGRLPKAVLVVSVEEAFFHCGKAMIRSQLWDPARILPRGSFPGTGRIISEQLKEGDPAELERRIE